MAANDNSSPGEWVVTFIPTLLLAALDRYMLEETKFDLDSGIFIQIMNYLLH